MRQGVPDKHTDMYVSSAMPTVDEQNIEIVLTLLVSSRRLHVAVALEEPLEIVFPLSVIY